MSILLFLICIVYIKREALFKRTLYLDFLHLPEAAILPHLLNLFSQSDVAGMNTVNVPTTAPMQNYFRLL